jgi:hypothetical protein
MSVSSTLTAAKVRLPVSDFRRAKAAMGSAVVVMVPAD